VIIKIADFMRFLSVLSLESGPALIDYRSSMSVGTSYSFVSINDEPAIKVFYAYPPNYWEVYQWNGADEQFEVIDMYRTNREQQEYQAIQGSQLVLSKDGNQAQITESLKQYLSLHTEVCAEYDWMCQSRVRNLPWLWYMLGLAYELEGMADQAVKTYWQLWHDYPESPYAIMAQYKLELIQP